MLHFIHARTTVRLPTFPPGRKATPFNSSTPDKIKNLEIKFGINILLHAHY